MQSEVHQLSLDRYIVVFLDINDAEDSPKRLNKIRKALEKAGATQSTTRTFLFHQKLGVTVPKICELVDNLAPDDCVSIIYQQEGKMYSTFVVAPNEKCAIQVQ